LLSVRAVRVHQHLLSRGDLSAADHDRARYALALDFLKAGLLDRAEESLRQLDHSAHATQARIALLGIYERSRDWLHAADMAAQLSQSGQGNFDVRHAHYLCEQAAGLVSSDPTAARGPVSTSHAVGAEQCACLPVPGQTYNKCNNPHRRSRP